MRSSIRMAAAGGIAALVAVVAAACGSEPAGSHPGNGSSPGAAGAQSPAQAVQAAYRSTTGEKTVSFRLSMTVNGAGSTGSASTAITGSGKADLARNAFTMSMNLPTGGSLATLESGGIQYVHVPAAQRSQIPGGKPWVSVNLNKVTQAMMGKSFSQLASAGNTNPAQALQQLTAVSSGVTKAGTATVGGVPTTEYRAKMSVDKLANQIQAKAGRQAAQMIRQQEKSLGSSVPVEVWVDANHLVRQVRYQIPLPSQNGGAGSGGTAMSTMTFTGFGQPVNVAPPPATQVTDVTSQVLREAKASGR